jgi:hypothetical protein
VPRRCREEHTVIVVQLQRIGEQAYRVSPWSVPQASLEVAYRSSAHPGPASQFLLSEPRSSAVAPEDLSKAG